MEGITNEYAKGDTKEFSKLPVSFGSLGRSGNSSVGTAGRSGRLSFGTVGSSGSSSAAAVAEPSFSSNCKFVYRIGEKALRKQYYSVMSYKRHRVKENNNIKTAFNHIF